MGLADDIVSQYKGSPAAGPAEPDADDGNENAARASARALISAVKQGDPEAVLEAIRSICG